MEELINQLIEYLKIHNSEPKTLEIIASQIVPILTMVIVTVSTVAGLIKYIQTKNREIYIDLLNSVYVPLYQYFVKQELYASIHMPDRNYKTTPILELKNQKIIYKTSNGKSESFVEESNLFKLYREYFVELKEKVNLGLASEELLTLLNMYEVLIFMESKYAQGSKEQNKAATIKINVENQIRKEVFSGYKKYRKKLGLKPVIENDLWKLNSDQIKFNNDLFKEEVESSSEKK